jgi:calcineurin-like phosphoesterase family protein
MICALTTSDAYLESFDKYPVIIWHDTQLRLVMYVALQERSGIR